MDKFTKTEKICKMISSIIPYKGSPTGLHNFTEHVDDILETCATPPDSVISKIIIRSIRDRIQDKAQDALEMYNTLNTWDDIKRNLISHFADKRDEDTLLQDLYNISQGNDNVEIFFAKILDITNALKSWSKLNDDILTSELKMKWYDKATLNVFCSRLREPLGSHVRSMKPDNIASARQICIREQNLHTLNKNIYKTSNLNSKPQILSRFTPREIYQSFPPQYNFPKPLKYNFVQPSQSLPNNQIYYNHRPFQPQPFQKHPFQQRPQILDRPEPMDTTSNHNGHKQPSYQKKRPISVNQEQQRKLQRIYNIETQEEIFDPNILESPHYEYPNQDSEYQNVIGTCTESIEEHLNLEPIIEINDEEDFHDRASSKITDT